MTDTRQTPEEQLLKHYREQQNGEPPANLDALILNAAHRQIPAPKPSLWQRWIKACQTPRYQVAFASLVGIALMLSLVHRAPEPVAHYDFAPAAKPAAPMARKEAIESRTLSAPAAPANGLDEQLREVLRLRESGQSQAADTLYNNLHKRYPSVNLDLRLEQIRQN